MFYITTINNRIFYDYGQFFMVLPFLARHWPILSPVFRHPSPLRGYCAALYCHANNPYKKQFNFAPAGAKKRPKG